MERANMEVKEEPITALEMARIMAQVVKMLVGRPMQVAIVKGLNRKLYGIGKWNRMGSLG